MRDLEIRGAGNLLGESQSGHIAAVGYDLYCQMVTEAVAEMKGEPIEPPAEIKLDVPTDAFLPADYVTKEELRLEAYRRLAAVTSESEVDDIRTEWEDRYGPLPEPAEALLMVGSLRAECHRLGITDMQITVSQARLSPIELKLSESMRLKRLARDAILKEDQRQLVVPIAPRQGPGNVPRRLPPRADPRHPTGRFCGRESPSGCRPGPPVAAAATGCSTFSDNDAAARVGEFELSQDELGELLVGATPRAEPDEPVEESARRPRPAQHVDPHPDPRGRPGRPATPPSTPPATPAAATQLEAAGPRSVGDETGRRCRPCRSNSRPRSRPGRRSRSRRRPTPSCSREYDAGTAESGIVCGAHILVETEAEAQAILDRLEGGADFAELAASESIDTGSGANGGNLPCALTALRETYVPEFVEAALAAEIGEPVGPVQSEFGYHVIVLRSSDQVDPAELAALYNDVTPRFQRAAPRSTSTSTRGSVRSTRPARRSARVSGERSGRASSSSASARAAPRTSRSRRSRRSSASRTGSCAPPAPVGTSRTRCRRVRRAVRVGRHVRRRLHRARRPGRAAAIDVGEVLYAVPGSPLVLERSVRYLVADDRVECTVLPALSFLDVAYARLGIDPVEVGLRLIDGHEFAVAAAGERGPLLVAHTHANWVLSDIKLAVEDARGDEEVVILQRLGTPTRRSRRRPGPSSTARSSPTT